MRYFWTPVLFCVDSKPLSEDQPKATGLYFKYQEEGMLGMWSEGVQIP